MRVGIMGGTFDPIHNGHLMLGETAYRQYNLDEVWYMPNGNPPHKLKSAIESDVKHRVAMVKLAIEGKRGLKLQDYEAAKEEVSFTYETLEHFLCVNKNVDFFYIIGADSLCAIETWSHPRRIFEACTILAAFRDDMDTSEEMYEQMDYLKEKYNARIALLAAPLMDISSHELRTRIKQGKSIAHLVPGKVASYIKKNHLYNIAQGDGGKAACEVKYRRR